MTGAILSSRPPDVPAAIMVGLPTFGTVSIEWHVQLHDMLSLGKPMNRVLFERVVKGHRVDEARNLLVREALDWKGEQGERVSHVFFVDDDVLVNRDTLIRLLSHDRDIVSGLYYAKSDVPQPLLFLQPKAGAPTQAEIPKTGLVDCYGHGMGCTLIRREVFEAIEPPWFATESRGRWENVREVKLHTEDTYFLEQAAAAGFQPCVDVECLVAHFDARTDRIYPPWLREQVA